MSKPVTKVAIVGAGSSGLVQLKQLLDAFSRPEVQSTLEVVVFEAREEIGGVWLSDDQPKPFSRADLPSLTKGDEGIEQIYFYPQAGSDSSPMYDGLRTNLPYQYLLDYTSHFSLRPHIRFHTRVERLFRTHSSPASSPRRWTTQSSGPQGSRTEQFDYVTVANGHYADGWVPEIPGLSSFRGQVLHSRYYRQPQDYAGKTVLVVGSFASGGDISRQIAGLNVGRYTPVGERIITTPTSESGDHPGPPTLIPEDVGSASVDGDKGFTKVYVSMSGTNKHIPDKKDPSQPWAAFIEYRPLIDHVSTPSSSSTRDQPSDSSDDPDRAILSGTIHFTDGSTLSNIDIIIFATGYNFLFPFCKTSDAPWSDHRMLDGAVREGERMDGIEEEVGGMKGLGVRELDETMLFLDGDRSVAFPALQYQIVPFPFAEIQTRLTSLLWADLLPSFPSHPRLPPNPSNPFFTPPPTPRSASPTTHATGDEATVTASGSAAEAPSASPSVSASDSERPPVRKVLAMQQKLVFGAPYEWTYLEFLMGLMAEAEEGREVEEHWRRIEGFRRVRREDSGLRKRTLGY